MAERNRMKEMPVNKLMVQMGIPMILSMALQAVYNIVDSAFVGNMKEGSEAALNALTLVFPVQMLMVAVGIGTGVGTNALLARTLGQGNSKKAAKVAGNSLFLGVIIYAVCLLFGIFGVKAYISSQTVDPEVIAMGTGYLRICCVISFGIIFFSLFEKLLQATGRSLYSTIGQVVGAVVNIILDPIFIFGYFGLPAMGVTGAALATIIGQFGAAILSIYLFSRHNEHIHISFKHFKIDFQVFKNLYSIAIPSGVMMCLPSVLVSILNGVLATISQTAVAFFGVYFKLQTFVYMPANGVIQGLRPIMSYNYGAKQKDRMDQSIKAAGLTIATILTLGTLLFSIFPTQILSLFNANQAMLEIGISGLRILSISFVLSTFGILMSGVFESLGKGNYSLIISLLRQFIIIIPLSLLFISHIGLSGVWLTFPLSESIASLIALILFIKVYKRINLID